MKKLVDTYLPWLIAHAAHLFIAFCIFMGAFFQFVNSKNIEDLSLPNRLFSVVMSVLVVGIGAAYIIDNLHWNVYATSILGILGGMGADKLLRLVLAMYSDSTSVVDFFGRISRAVRAGMKVFNATNPQSNDNDNDSN